MGYSQFRIFEQSGHATSGAPTITGSAIKLFSEDVEINNTEISISTEETTRTYRGDNRRKEDKILEGLNLTIGFYAISLAARAAITADRVDSNGVLVMKSSTEGNPTVTVFFNYEDEKGQKFNVWLYDVEFSVPGINGKQAGDNPEAQSIGAFASLIKYNGESTPGVMVPSTASSYIAEGTEPTAAGLVLPAAIPSGN